jgi:endonuclease/exonuclease/phosphatase family metal-dependent hydrolase
MGSPRVASFNIALGSGTGGIPGVIRHLRDDMPRADLVFLQECDRNARNGGGDHARQVAEGAGHRHGVNGGYTRRLTVPVPASRVSPRLEIRLHVLGHPTPTSM